MADAVQAIWRAMVSFAQSDLGPVPSPRWHIILTGQIAHILIGAVLALYRAPLLLVLVVFCGWVAKELLGDIPNSGGVWLVMADSVADLFFGALGYIVAKSQMEKARQDRCQRTEGANRERAENVEVSK
ncbi:hypothetical protein ACN2XU_23875 [Primorskyibacter sp. 2E107]|uniref:hypothetical protein n=1 Tax=Primorskyibacter sp. 2E107 TaxID=3403458 RepID=UPI003AF674BE